MTLCAFYNLTHSNLTWFTTYTDRWCLSLFLIPPSISLPDIHRSFLSLMSVCWALLCDLHVVCMWMREREMENMYVDSNLHFFVFRILTALWLFISLCLLLRLRLCVSVCMCVLAHRETHCTVERLCMLGYTLSLVSTTVVIDYKTSWKWLETRRKKGEGRRDMLWWCFSVRRESSCCLFVQPSSHSLPDYRLRWDYHAFSCGLSFFLSLAFCHCLSSSDSFHACSFSLHWLPFFCFLSISVLLWSVSCDVEVANLSHCVLYILYVSCCVFVHVFV